MNKCIYDVSFVEILEEIAKDGKLSCWYQGENFADGFILQYNEDLNLLELRSPSSVEKAILFRGLITQKYRRIYTYPDALRNC